MGDEWCHWTADMDGRLMVMEAEGIYRYANEAEQQELELRQQQASARRAASRAARRRADERGDDDPSADGLPSHFNFPSKGHVRGLVVLVEYPDQQFRHDLYGDPLYQYSDMMMLPGYNYSNGRYTHRGSAHDFFYQNSSGLFDPQFDVYGPLMLKNNYAYYGRNVGGNDVRPYEMVIEACDQLKERGIDFTPYDNDNDGYIDFVFAIYAGPGENGLGGSDAVWPHAWEMSSAGEGNKHSYDGLILESYACTCELYRGMLDGVGTFCHEFSHVMGLMDHYNTENGQATKTNSPFNYDILDNGCYQASGYCPVNLNAYERYELGWLQPELLEGPATIRLEDFGTTGQAYMLPITPDLEDPREGEYYIFENRQKTGWDTYLPGHGMLVWHIDYARDKWYFNKVNTWKDHQCVDLIEADGDKMSNSMFVQDASTPFPGTAGHTEFTDTTVPAFSSWLYPKTSSLLTKPLGKPITNICESPSGVAGVNVITFDYMGGESAIGQVQNDTSTTRRDGLCWRNGKLYIQQAGRCLDLLGRP